MKRLLATSICVLLLAALPRATAPQAKGASALSRGQAASRAGRFADAAREYQQALDRDPANGAARMGLVRALLKDERIDEAGRAAERACDDGRANASLLAACADVWFRQGDFARAERLYAAAVAADPSCARGYWGLGRVDLVERRNRSARQHFTTAHELVPADPDIALDWAFAQGGPKEAIEAAERYLAVAVANDEDAQTLAGIRARIAILRALDGRETFVVSDARRGYRLQLHEAPGPDGPPGAYRLFAIVNGQKLRLTVDTGTSGIYVNRKAAERSHLVRLAEGVPMRRVGGEPPRSTFFALADAVRIDELEMAQCEIKVDSGRAFDDGDGVIGTDIFSRFLVRLNFPARAVELLPPAPGERSIAQDFWSVERQVRPGFTPVHVFGHLLLAESRIDNVPGILLAIDSGAPTPILSTRVASRIPGVRLVKAMVRGVSGRLRETVTTGRVTLAFGNLLARPGKLPAVDLGEPNRRQGVEIGGMIGLDVLRQFDLTIDYTNGLVRLDRPR